eukprot:6064139-Alexandrium_andersonii.AAC.1
MGLRPGDCRPPGRRPRPREAPLPEDEPREAPPEGPRCWHSGSPRQCPKRPQSKHCDFCFRRRSLAALPSRSLPGSGGASGAEAGGAELEP